MRDFFSKFFSQVETPCLVVMKQLLIFGFSQTLIYGPDYLDKEECLRSNNLIVFAAEIAVNWKNPIH